MQLFINRPPHGRYLFSNLDDSTYVKYVKKYSSVKRHGYRAIVAWATGLGIKDVVIEACKGTVRKWGREKIGIIIVSCCIYVATLAVAFITNSSRWLRTAKVANTFVSCTAEYIEDSANLTYLPLDVVLFGCPVPIGQEGRFNIFGNFADFLDIE